MHRITKRKKNPIIIQNLFIYFFKYTRLSFIYDVSRSENIFVKNSFENAILCENQPITPTN